MYLGCSLPQINDTGGFISQALAEWQEAFAAVCNQDEVLSANDTSTPGGKWVQALDEEGR